MVLLCPIQVTGWVQFKNPCPNVDHSYTYMCKCVLLWVCEVLVHEHVNASEHPCARHTGMRPIAHVVYLYPLPTSGIGARVFSPGAVDRCGINCGLVYHQIVRLETGFRLDFYELRSQPHVLIIPVLVNQGNFIPKIRVFSGYFDWVVCGYVRWGALRKGTRKYSLIVSCD